jgi:hypothetical protein
MTINWSKLPQTKKIASHLGKASVSPSIRRLSPWEVSARSSFISSSVGNQLYLSKKLLDRFPVMKLMKKCLRPKFEGFTISQMCFSQLVSLKRHICPVTASLLSAGLEYKAFIRQSKKFLRLYKLERTLTVLCSAKIRRKLKWVILHNSKILVINL